MKSTASDKTMYVNLQMEDRGFGVESSATSSCLVRLTSCFGPGSFDDIVPMCVDAVRASRSP